MYSSVVEQLPCIFELLGLLSSPTKNNNNKKPLRLNTPPDNQSRKPVRLSDIEINVRLKSFSHLQRP